MKKSHNLRIFYHNFREQVIDPLRILKNVRSLFKYLRDIEEYSQIKGSEPIELKNAHPCLHEKTTFTSFDPHYFYQDIWAFKKIFESTSDYHIDVGSNVNWVGLITIIKKTTFIDIRPLIAELNNFESKKGNILSLPYEDDSVKSLSCLHVAEHIGLGRYGDRFDPLGTKKAARELSRVISPKGDLYFSLPIGKPRLCFNAHRIHSTGQILRYFSNLELKELSGIDDRGNFIINVERETLDSCNYGCGLFWFTKK